MAVDDVDVVIPDEEEEVRLAEDEDLAAAAILKTLVFVGGFFSGFDDIEKGLEEKEEDAPGVDDDSAVGGEGCFDLNEKLTFRGSSLFTSAPSIFAASLESPSAAASDPDLDPGPDPDPDPEPLAVCSCSSAASAAFSL